VVFGPGSPAYGFSARNISVRKPSVWLAVSASMRARSASSFARFASALARRASSAASSCAAFVSSRCSSARR